MDVEGALRFVAENHRAIFCARRKDGSPQMSPVAAAVVDGAIVVSSRETAIKVKNVRRDARVSLCVVNDGWWGPWIQVDGTAEVVSLPEAMDGLVAYYRQVSGEHPDWDDYRSAMEREQRVVIRVTAERAGPNVSG